MLTSPKIYTANEQGEFPFLGTLGGVQGYTLSTAKKEQTYSRTYRTHNGYGMCDELRKSLAGLNGTEMQKVGNEYSYTPLRFRTVGSPLFSFWPGYMQGGGYFLSKRCFEKDDSWLSPASYAISQYGQEIERISGYDLASLQAQTDAYSINYIIHQYFDSVTSPQEDDLVVYSEPKKEAPCMPVGIFKNTEPNWNSPSGGTVVSKYNYNSQYVFQHDVFFTPDWYGNVAKFYRLKKNPVKPKQFKKAELKEGEFIEYSVSMDGFICNKTPEKTALRQNIDTVKANNLSHTFPQIQILDQIDFHGVCYSYAFGKFLNTYEVPEGIPSLESPTEIGKILTKYFDTTTQPEKGDIAVYYSGSTPVHYGIYLAKDLIESKWGPDPVFRHPYFDVPSCYGNQIKFFKLKAGVSKEMLLKNLKMDANGCSKDAPIVVKQDDTGKSSLLLYSYRKPKMVYKKCTSSDLTPLSYATIPSSL